MKIFSVVSLTAILSHLTPSIEAVSSNYKCDRLVLGGDIIDRQIEKTFPIFPASVRYEYEPHHVFSTVNFFVYYNFGQVQFAVEFSVQKKPLSVKVKFNENEYTCEPTTEEADVHQGMT
ncbi:BgTH12-05037 [Blumeria graminis f. sp. triticale]|uniref:BgTH12-05037 n=1 Tax=Blumeria graminis f. sp. triticale TaxID=1689686 RepID=A0A9W4GG24_BLUGR|nr:BgTH12-05037 [Blumeria graminis f. sp. triticale]